MDSAKIIQKHPIKSINQFSSQYFPNYSEANKALYFTARESNHQDEELYVSYYSNNQFETPQKILELNQENNEGTMTISSDGKKMIFSACDYPNSYGGCDLFETNWNGKEWSKPKNLGYLVNSHDWEGHPYLSKDGNTLYFSSDRPGGLGKKDIWKSQKNEKGLWQIPKNLGNVINTKLDEQSPFILEEKKLLIFSSDKKGGLGGLDFYQSLEINSDFGEPKNILELNSSKDDAGFSLGINENEYFISSSLEGKDQIYEVILPNEIWLKAPAIEKKETIDLSSFNFDDIQFKKNEWNLPAEPLNSLIRLVDFLQLNGIYNIKISGHTDEIGTEENNQILSEKRALAVKLFLIKRGIASERIHIQGYGYSKTKSTNHSVNRRIEIEIRK
jgi:outer membrane protein OmpA-like peptidoglycan-associated protein